MVITVGDVLFKLWICLLQSILQKDASAYGIGKLSK